MDLENFSSAMEFVHLNQSKSSVEETMISGVYFLVTSFLGRVFGNNGFCSLIQSAYGLSCTISRL